MPDCLLLLFCNIPPPLVPDVLYEVLRELRYIGNNLNQIARVANATGDLNVKKEKINKQIEFIINNQKSMYGKVKRCKDPILKEDYQKDIQIRIDKVDEIESSNSYLKRIDHTKEITI